MKILMLGWELPPHNSGGLGVACYELAKALSSSGADIDFVLPHAATPETAAVPFMKVHHTGLKRPSADTNAYTGDYASIRELQAQYNDYVTHYLETETPSVIHAHDWLTLEAGVQAKKISGVPLIAHVHATEYDRAGGQYGNPFIHEIEAHGLAMADRIIAVSNVTKKLIVEKYNIPEDKIEVVHNSVSPEELLLQTAPERVMYRYIRAMQDEGLTVVMTLGRLTIQKGITYFLQAAAQASEAYDRFLFVIAGDGEQRDELIQMSADLGIADRVLFTGFVRGQAWRELYEIADIFVMNSVSEPFGLTALEAAVKHTPIILSRQTGVSEVLKNTLQYEYWDITGIADGLINIAASEGLRYELSEGSARDFTKVSWTSAAENCLRQYRRTGALV